MLIVENIPDIFLQPFQPITSLRHLEIWGTELTDFEFEMIVRNAPNLVILKCCLDENYTTVESLRHLRWLRSLEEFVVLDEQHAWNHRLRNLLDEILLHLPHLKVACSKAADDIYGDHQSLGLNHFVPLGIGELPLEHLVVGAQNFSTTQAKMLPNLKSLALNVSIYIYFERVQKCRISLRRWPFNFEKNLDESL